MIGCAFRNRCIRQTSNRPRGLRAWELTLFRFRFSAVNVLCVVFFAGSVCFAIAAESLPRTADASPNAVRGTITLAIDAHRLSDHGISLSIRDSSNIEVPEPPHVLRSQISRDSTLDVILSNDANSVVQGSVSSRGALTLVRDESRVAVGNFTMRFTEKSWEVIDGLNQGDRRVAFEVRSKLIDAPKGSRSFRLAAEIAVSPWLAGELNAPRIAGVVVGQVTLEVEQLLERESTPEPESSQSPEPESIGAAASVIGPDVIVGSLYQVSSYGGSGGISAFSVGTVSCNIGDVWLNWFANNNQHPVIGQNMFRLKNGRFEQVGQSWLKHGFFALSDSLCYTDCQATDGTHLGVHCSDPYSAALNGTQSNLGPKWQVDAHTGSFPFPPANPGWFGVLSRRLQVRNFDLDPSLGGGGQYFVEGQYVTPDDAAAGNQDNNASFRPITVSGIGQLWSIELASTTQRQKPAIRAWKAADPLVRETDIRVPDDGLVILAAKASDLGGGSWHYEYAVHNLNSHRSVQSFSIPIDPGGTVTNIGFRDVDYHSGEPFSTTDWTPTVFGGSITWSTQSYSENSNANALRWGTLYNFRFDINRQPQTTTATLGLFRPGTPSSVTAVTTGPITSPADCNNNGLPDSIDIVEGTSRDCDGDTVPDECQSYVPAAVRVATGLDRPTHVTAPPQDPTRVFIVEQAGRIRILAGGAVLPTPFLDLSSFVGSSGENGLWSLAFDQNYAGNRRFYVMHSDPAGNIVIARYLVSTNMNAATPSTRTVLMTITPSSTVRSGGQIAFGPDGYLYVGIGDGAGMNDPFNRGQDTGTLRGKILRLDVNNPPSYIPASNPYSAPGLPLDEIWSIGVRDPWRFSFDRGTGELYFADIGQSSQDEINIRPPTSLGGENYGWRCMEGSNCTGLSGCTCNGGSLTPPSFTHTRSGGECRITGGHAYRGCALPNLLGTYFWADYCTGTIRSFRYTGGAVTEQLDRTTQLTPIEGPITQIVSFGEDADGELYIVSYSGSVYKIIRDPSGGSTCGNGTVEPGEECDDNNTMPGDGCDSFCRIEPGPPNDHCSNAFPIGDGQVLFDSAGATTSGPDETIACQGDGTWTPLGSDLWYCYTAPCSGTATISLCNSSFDTMAAVYDGCSCPSAPSASACGDFGCGDDAVLTIPVTACRSYMVRIGGYDGDQGAGVMDITCDPDPVVNDCNGNGIDDAVDISCGTAEDNNGNLVPDTCETDGDPIRGGRLFDRWWSQTGANPPTTDHPLWAFRPDPVSNQAAGAATWRCVECHGWDYKGADGEYGSGPHRTGITGILGSTLSAAEMFTLLKDPPSNGGGTGVLNGHDYGSVLADPFLNDLVAFVLLGTLDTDVFIESGSGDFLGNAKAGQANYTTGGVVSQCISCHGPNGADINFGTVFEPEYLGTVAVNEPTVFLHRARMGFPGSPMQGWLANGGTDQGAADIGRYAQLQFPTECVDESQCSDGVPCTTDSCDAAGRCLHVPNDSACSGDGVFCNGIERCDAQVGCVSPGNPCSLPSACNETEDHCGCATPVVVAAGSRYLSVTLQPPGSSVPTALRITPECALGVSKYVGTPSGSYNVAFAVDQPADAARLTPAGWGSTVYLSGFEIAPGISYRIESDCGASQSPVFTPAAVVQTFAWGDVVNRFAPGSLGPPDGMVDFSDISALVDGFRGLPSAMPLYRTDLFGCVPNQSIDFIDIAGDVDAFKGFTYLGSSGCPGPCW